MHLLTNQVQFTRRQLQNRCSNDVDLVYLPINALNNITSTHTVLQMMWDEHKYTMLYV